jgi:hypothetical protein
VLELYKASKPYREKEDDNPGTASQDADSGASWFMAAPPPMP